MRFTPSKASPAARRSREVPGMILFSTRLWQAALLGEVEIAERLGVRGEHSLASPRGAARAPPVRDPGPARPRRDDVQERAVVCRRAYYTRTN
jgi:hypothetical protein